MQIRIRHHDGREERVELDAARTLRFGTRSTADVILQGPDVRSQHFGILLRDGAFTVVAFKKVGKVRVNGKMVRKRALKKGDRIEVGDNVIEVMVARDTSSDSKPQSRQRAKSRTSQRSESRQAAAPDAALPDEVLEELSDLDQQPDLLSDVGDDLLSIDEQDLTPDPISEPSVRSNQTSQTAAARTGPSWIHSTWFRLSVVVTIIVPLIVLIVLYVRQMPDAQQRFQIAYQFYERGDYPSAVEAFADYMEHHRQAGHIDESFVKWQLALMLSDLDRGVDAETLLTSVQESIIAWGPSRNSAYAQSGLAGLLPALVADFTRESRVSLQQGNAAAARDSLRRAEDSLMLIYRYLAPSLQRDCGVEQLQVFLTRLQRELSRPVELKAVLSRIEGDMAGGGIEDAYVVRAQLLAAHPDLATDGRLLASMRAVGRNEVSRVEPLLNTELDHGRRSQQRDPVWQQVLVASQSSNEAGLPDVVIPLEQLGTFYGFDTATGQVRWRYVVGSGTDHAPLPVERTGYVLYDAVCGELVCVAAANGAVEWRFPLASLAGIAPVDQNRAICSATDGSVRALEVADGSFVKGLKLPQKLCVGPVVDPVAPRCYQVAEHSMVYVLAADQSECLSAYYLGHEQGSVGQSPFVIGEHLLVCEQVGPDQSVVHVLQCGDRLDPVQSVAFEATPAGNPVVLGARIYWPARDGRVHALRYDRNEPRRPLRYDLVFDPGLIQLDERMPVRLAADNGQLWAAGIGAVLLRDTASGSPPQQERREWENMRISQLVRSNSGSVVAVGTRGRSGPFAVCCAADSDSTAELPIASSPVAAPLVHREGGFAILLSNGSLARVSKTGQISQVSDRWVQRSSLLPARPDHGIRLPPYSEQHGSTGVIGPFPDAGSVAVVAFDSERSEPYLLRHSPTLACRPVLVGRFLALAQRHGPITLYDVKRRDFAAGAFLPDVSRDVLPDWCAPAAISDNELVVNDGIARLFLLQVSDDGESIEQVHVSDKSIAFASSLIAVGKTVWGVSKDGELCRVVMPLLDVEQHATLEGDLQWGPTLVGEWGYLATTQGKLYCFGGTREIDWISQLEIGPVVGVCPMDETHLAVASSDGTVAVLDAASGHVVAPISLHAHQRIAFGPLLLQGRLVVITADGSLLILRKPMDEAIADSVSEGAEQDGIEESLRD